MKGLLSIFLASFLVLTDVSAQEGSYVLDIEVSDKNPGLKTQFEITYTFKFKGNSLSLFNPSMSFVKPPIDQFFRIIDEGRPQKNMFDFGQGGIVIYDYIFILEADKEGVYTIPPAKFIFEGTEYKSKTATISVSKNKTPTQLGQGDLVFIEAYPQKKNPYLGEEFRLSYKLYSKYEPVQVLKETQPFFENFTQKTIPPSESNRLKIETINGEKFYTLDLFEVILYPLKSGSFLIDPFKFEFVALVETGRIVRDFWGQRKKELSRKKIEIKSKSLKVNILDLPKPRPSSFDGAVGNFKIQEEISDTIAKAGEALTYRLMVSGSGNLAYLEAPKLGLPDDFEIYEPKEKTSRNRKTFEYLIIPKRAGNYRVKPSNFSYFNPIQKKYVELQTKELNLEIKKGDPGSGNIISTDGLLKEEVELIGKDIRFIKTSDIPATKKEFNSNFSIPYIILSLIVLGFPGLWYYHKHWRLSHSNTQDLLKRKARKIARKNLKTARINLEKGDLKMFYKELQLGLVAYASFAFDLDQANFSAAQLQEKLNDAGIEAKDSKEYIGLVAYCDSALYSPTLDSTNHSDQLDKAESLIIKLEESRK